MYSLLPWVKVGPIFSQSPLKGDRVGEPLQGKYQHRCHSTLGSEEYLATQGCGGYALRAKEQQ